MKTKDALVGLMFWLIALVIVFSGSIESAPLGFVIAAVVIVWSLYIFVIIRDYKREKNRPIFWLEIDGEWRAIDHTGNLVPKEKMPPKPIDNQIYDQEEDDR